MKLKSHVMKKTVILLLALVLGTAVSFAQPRDGQREMNPEDMAKRQTERLDEALDLSKEQEKQVYDLNLESGKKMRKMREENRGDWEAMRDQMRDVREEQNEKMKKILTDEQWNKYEKYMEERRERMRNEGQRRRR